MSWNATADIGNVAAAVIAGGPAAFAGKRVGVNGEEATLADVAAAFSKVFGKKVSGGVCWNVWLAAAMLLSVLGGTEAATHRPASQPASLPASERGGLHLPTSRS